MQPFGQLALMLRPYWKFMAQSLLVGVLITFLSLPGPYFTKVLVDQVHPHADFGLLYFLLALGGALSTFLGLTGGLHGYFAQQVGIGMSFDFQARLYRHLQGLDFGFFDRRETGELLSRFGDMQAAIDGTIDALNALVVSCLQLLVFPAVLFYIHWKLALLSVAILPVDALLGGVTGRYARRLSQRLAEESAQLAAKTCESLAGIRAIQSLGTEGLFYARLCGLFNRVAELQRQSALLHNSAGFLATLLKTGGILAYGWYGWTQVLQGHLSLGTYLAFSGYTGYLYGPLERLIGLWPQFQSTLVHARRFFEIYELKPQIRDQPELPALTRARGTIGLRRVSFAYGGAPVLSRVDLEIPAGAFLALVGRSGAGKSTLARLIPRFYDPDEGQVTLDGRDVRHCRLGSLRRQIGFVMQGNVLFQGSILDNLRLGCDCSLAEVEQAMRAVCLGELVNALPAGYDTVVGEGGVGLSEGQKQRLVLARVLLRDPPVLILDEATAALDAETERHILESLRRTRQGRTTLLIAHSLSAIRWADEIAVLDNGAIAERGSHELLMLRGGVYAGLYEQLAGAMAEG